MSFKESYKKDYEDIKPDNEFKKQLSAKMKAEPRRSIPVPAYFAAAAAAVAIAGGVRFFAAGDDEAVVIEEYGVTVTTVSSAMGLLPSGKWYTGTESDEEKWELFTNLIGSGDIESLYCGMSKQLGDEDILNSESTAELSRRLAAAEPCDSVELSGKIYFCMAVFEDGRIVKFQISENGEVKLNDAELIRKIEKNN